MALSFEEHCGRTCTEFFSTPLAINLFSRQIWRNVNFYGAKIRAFANCFYRQMSMRVIVGIDRFSVYRAEGTNRLERNAAFGSYIHAKASSPNFVMRQMKRFYREKNERQSIRKNVSCPQIFVRHKEIISILISKWRFGARKTQKGRMEALHGICSVPATMATPKKDRMSWIVEKEPR